MMYDYEYIKNEYTKKLEDIQWRRKFTDDEQKLYNEWKETLNLIFEKFPDGKVKDVGGIFFPEYRLVLKVPYSETVEWKEYPTDYNTDGWECSTRALSYCSGEKLDVIKYKQEQYAIKRFKRVERWNNHYAFKYVLSDYSWFELNNRQINFERIANILQSIKSPVLIESKDHIAVIHNGNIIDHWDSRNCRSRRIGFKNEGNISDIIKILELHNIYLSEDMY